MFMQMLKALVRVIVTQYFGSSVKDTTIFQLLWSPQVCIETPNSEVGLTNTPAVINAYVSGCLSDWPILFMLPSPCTQLFHLPSFKIWILFYSGDESFWYEPGKPTISMSLQAANTHDWGVPKNRIEQLSGFVFLHTLLYRGRCHIWSWTKELLFRR